MTDKLKEDIPYFAYGSNMLTSRLRERTPSARPLCQATLSGYSLRFHKISKKDGSGKCDAFETGAMEDTVHGMVFLIDPAEKAELDRAEGLGYGYMEKTVTLQTISGQMEAVMYIATTIDADLKPYNWYKELVVAGAIEHQLPRDYITAIQCVVSETDPDSKRNDEAAKLLRNKPR